MVHTADLLLVDLLKDVLESAVILLQDGVLGAANTQQQINKHVEEELSGVKVSSVSKGRGTWICFSLAP